MSGFLITLAVGIGAAMLLSGIRLLVEKARR